MSPHAYRTIAITASTLLIGVVLAACGKNDATEPAPPPPPALTAAEFRVEADAICAAADSDLNDAFTDLDAFTDGELTPEQRTAAEGALDQAARIIDQQGQDIGALGEPASLTSVVTQLVAAFRDGANRMRQDGLDLYLSAEDDPLAEALATAQALGLEVCGSAG